MFERVHFRAPAWAPSLNGALFLQLYLCGVVYFLIARLNALISFMLLISDGGVLNVRAPFIL